MEELIVSFVDWFIDLGKKYGVNPIIFGSIYIGAIPFFSISIVWLIRNYRSGKQVVIPALLATFFFISAYLYLIVEGKNVPWWVYGIIVFLVIYGGWSTYRKVRKRIQKINQQKITDE
jgi:ABC-type Co2+ transport system permease subunit